MKRARGVEASAAASRRWRLYHLVLASAAIYLIIISFKFRRFLDIASSLAAKDEIDTFAGSLNRPLSSADHPFHLSANLDDNPNPTNINAKIKPLRYPYGRITAGGTAAAKPTTNLTELERMADEAWTLGTTAWDDLLDDLLLDSPTTLNQTAIVDGRSESCPTSVSMSGHEAAAGIDGEKLMFLPCGLAVGSAITIVGKPLDAHEEYVPQIKNSGNADGIVLVSQFMVELQGLKAVDGEDPPRILHFNPRLRGDWSHTPVIEHNTCYRMQWGTAMRCNGIPSKDEDDTVDGFSKCEKWVRSDIVDSKESKTTSWLQRFIGRAKKPAITWPFPFGERRLFILTLQAGVEGYHVNVGGDL